MTTNSGKQSLIAALQAIQQTATGLAQSSAALRSQALKAMARSIGEYQDAILEANTLDLELSREMAVPDTVIDWLKLTPERINRTAEILDRLAALGDLPGFSPLGSWAAARLRPLGVVALVYEAFPDLGAITSGLCLRTGNALVLRGGSESSQTNQVLVSILQDAIASADLPKDSILLIPPEWGEVSRGFLVQQAAVDLVIPYGRSGLVSQVVEQATVPILPTHMGNCYLCLCPSARLETVVQMILHSHRGEPDAVNRIEKVIVVGFPNEGILLQLWRQMRDAGYELRGDVNLCETYRDLEPVTPDEWEGAYNGKTLAFRQATDLATAIDWINQHSSGHADSIATQNYEDSRQFIAAIRSASVYINTSPRFRRNPKEAMAIALGMSNQAGRWGGLVGMDALTKAQHIMHCEPNRVC